MTTSTNAEIHATITAALGDRAKLLRKGAASRQMSGPARAEARKAIRAEAQRCEDLQCILGHVGPEALAKVLETEIRAYGGV